MARFTPLRKRDDPDAAAAHAAVLHDGIPPHLRSTVADFLLVTLTDVNDTYYDRTIDPDREALQSLERELEHPLDWRTKNSLVDGVINDALNNPAFGLDAVDHQLQRVDLKHADKWGDLSEEGHSEIEMPSLGSSSD